MLTINNTLDGYLKDVEIKGNTIQDIENLADIRSVGDKVEGQELYEIPVLSRGKNVCKDRFLEDMKHSTNRYFCNNGGYATPNGIIYLNKGSYIMAIENTDMQQISLDANIYIWKKDKNFSSCRTSKISSSFTINDDEVGITFYASVSSSSVLNDYVGRKIQIEEGTVATPYEPYVEDKLTILSPTPLEKVGDVADRIIEKDGVWGVEKNIGIFDDFLNCNLSVWSNQNTDTGVAFYITSDLHNQNVSTIISNKFLHDDPASNKNNFVGNSYRMYILRGRIPKDSLSSENATGVKEYLHSIGAYVKYVVAQPTFIPLPHDQQVKLRTFANKTNISFLTEIEGTIKAQVPKSLGATVNTHTEQINNLNNELNRVKKLEESTVSTVTNESDFTTVEATSNGYFEDVKLEGKTLVNLCTHLYDQKHNSVIDKGSVLNYTKHPHYTQCDFKLLQNLKQNTTYTVVLNATNFVEGMSLQVNFYKYGEWVVCGNTEYVRNKGVHTILLTTNENVADHIRIGKMNNDVENLDEYITLSKDIIILEGDHTQNPPSGYIEGLKSVGQSATTSEDGADEIVVSSVTNGNLFDGKWINGGIGLSNGVDNSWANYIKTSDFESIFGGVKYTYNAKIGVSISNSFVYLYDKDKNFTRTITNPGKLSATFTTFKNEVYCRFAINGASLTIDNFEGFELCIGDKTTYTPHQSDKKRLLYYNEKTQTWEKPILRQWDSIEKHSNGKYYYHQRSGEVVLNGSENWKEFEKSDTHVKTSLIVNNIKNTSILICDRFKHYELDYAGVWEYEGVSSINSHYGIIINCQASKLSTQDVAGFKQWLQANNVTVVYQLAQEKVYECTNIDLITYANETNYIVESGVLSPKTTLKVHSNISNVVSLLQKKVSLLESNMTKYMITQNRLQLSSTHSADSVTFKVDYTVCSENMSQENYDTDLYNLILNNILVGKDNYNYDRMFNIIMDYASWSQISWDQFDILVGIMDIQHNPPIEEIPTDDEIVEEIPNEIM